jgi:hypothetical protein
VRSCLGILRLGTRYPGEQLEAACVQAMAAGASSSGFVEHLLKKRATTHQCRRGRRAW